MYLTCDIYKKHFFNLQIMTKQKFILDISLFFYGNICAQYHCSFGQQIHYCWYIMIDLGSYTTARNLQYMNLSRKKACHPVLDFFYTI